MKRPSDGFYDDGFMIPVSRKSVEAGGGLYVSGCLSAPAAAAAAVNMKAAET